MLTSLKFQAKMQYITMSTNTITIQETISNRGRFRDKSHKKDVANPNKLSVKIY